jgi:hypothetical protein
LRRRRASSSLSLWIAGAALVAFGVYLGRRRGRLMFAAFTAALTDHALRALADTFREEDIA